MLLQVAVRRRATRMGSPASPPPADEPPRRGMTRSSGRETRRPFGHSRFPLVTHPGVFCREGGFSPRDWRCRPATPSDRLVQAHAVSRVPPTPGCSVTAPRNARNRLRPLLRAFGCGTAGNCHARLDLPFASPLLSSPVRAMAFSFVAC